MSTVGVKELKNRLTEYLRRTKKGEEIIVTERRKPIAVIQPIDSVEQLQTLEAKLAKLAALGIVTLPVRKPSKKVRLVSTAGRPVSETILAERR
ncbi:MAG: type II toxin-antitoxin system Phd/YefM family antitoxin [Vicinamibacteria bacterium]